MGGKSVKRVLPVLLFVLLLSGVGAADITEMEIVNLFPDEEAQERDTHIVTRFDAGSTTSTMAYSYIFRPNGQVNRTDMYNVTVKSSVPLERTFDIEKKYMNSFGEYRIVVNETDGMDTSTNFTIIPAPQVTMDVGDLIKDPQEENQDYVSINVNPRVGRSIGGDDLVDRNLTVYRITSEETTGTGVEKELVRSVEPGISNQSDDLEAVIDFTDLPEGTYQVTVRFNITSCDACPKFEEVESTSVRVREQLDLTLVGLTAAFFLMAFIFIVIARILSAEEKGQKIFFLGTAWLFSLMGMAAVISVAQESGYGGIADLGTGVLYIGIPTLIVWLIFIVSKTFTDIGRSVFSRIGG